MEKARDFLTESFAAYKRLSGMADDAYHFANSMQTSQRKIPFSGGYGGVATNYLWSQLIPLYQKELADFQTRVKELKENPNAGNVIDESKIRPWPAAPFKLVSTNAETYTVREGARPFMDRYYEIKKLAPELRGLTGIRFSHEEAKNGRYEPVEIETTGPVRVLIGYFKNPRPIWLQVPRLETAAQADERGGIDTVIENAALIQNCPNVDVHAFRYGPGRHRLEFIGKGSFVILGVVPQSVELKERDARIGVN
jgi:hypothetical protein